MGFGNRWLPKESVGYGLAYNSASAHAYMASSFLSSGFYEMGSPNGH